jgi:hypothetical protein
MVLLRDYNKYNCFGRFLVCFLWLPSMGARIPLVAIFKVWARQTLGHENEGEANWNIGSRYTLRARRTYSPVLRTTEAPPPRHNCFFSITPLKPVLYLMESTDGVHVSSRFDHLQHSSIPFTRSNVTGTFFLKRISPKA